jgi:hypothetical protein
MGLNITIDDSSLNDIRQLLGERRANKALQAATSRTITTGVALIARRIGEEVKLPIADIKKTIDAKRGSYDQPSGSLSVQRGKTVWLAQFLSQIQRRVTIAKIKGAPGMFKQTRPKGGVRVSVRKKPTPQYPVSEQLVHAFLEYMPKAVKVGIFERIGIKRIMKSGRYRSKLREVIRRKRGPTPLGVFLNAQGEGGLKTMIEEIEAKLAEVYRKNVLSQVDRFLNPRGGDTSANVNE